ASYAKAQDALDDASTDAFFICAARRMARYLDAAGLKNYLYSFDGKVDPILPVLKDKAFHSVEIPFVFGNDYLLGKVLPEYVPLVGTVQTYWTNFAKTQDPSGGSAVPWPAYTTAGDQHLTLGAEVKAGTGLKKDQCDFWDQTPPIGL